MNNSAPDQNIPVAQTDVVIPPSDLPPPKPPAKFKKLWPLMALVLFLPVAVGAVLVRQSVFSSAAQKCDRIARIAINPSTISAFTNSVPIGLSTLAFDIKDQPIWSGVSYEWGISSTNSVGNLIPNREISSFYPKNAGTGDIWVKATNKCTKNPVMVSVKVNVSSAPTPTPTVVLPTPRATPTAAPTPTSAPLSEKRVFISSVTYDGNLGGLVGADAKCQNRATVAALGGTWKAWLSNDIISASSRLSHANVLYKRIDNSTVAIGWEDLADGSLRNPINISELGTTINATWVWTNSTAYGDIRQDQGNSCLNWLSTSSGGGTGDSTRTDSGWSDYGASSCYYLRPIYCIEQ